MWKKSEVTPSRKQVMKGEGGEGIAPKRYALTYSQDSNSSRLQKSRATAGRCTLLFIYDLLLY